MRIKRNPLIGHNLFSAYRDVSGATLLHKAVELRDYNKVAFYAQFPQLIDARNFCGQSALHYCALTNSPYSAKILINCGADINAVNELNQTPLMEGVLLNSIAFVNYIFNVRTSVQLTRKTKKVTTYQLKKICVDPFIEDYKGFTVAHYADLFAAKRMKQAVEYGLARMKCFAIKTGNPDYFNPAYLTLFSDESYTEYLLEKGERLLGWR